MPRAIGAIEVRDNVPKSVRDCVYDQPWESSCGSVRAGPRAENWMHGGENASHQPSLITLQDMSRNFGCRACIAFSQSKEHTIDMETLVATKDAHVHITSYILGITLEAIPWDPRPHSQRVLAQLARRRLRYPSESGSMATTTRAKVHPLENAIYKTTHQRKRRSKRIRRFRADVCFVEGLR